jgi:hypothetical protein
MDLETTITTHLSKQDQFAASYVPTKPTCAETDTKQGQWPEKRKEIILTNHSSREAWVFNNQWVLSKIKNTPSSKVACCKNFVLEVKKHHPQCAHNKKKGYAYVLEKIAFASTGEPVTAFVGKVSPEVAIVGVHKYVLSFSGRRLSTSILPLQEIQPNSFLSLRLETDTSHMTWISLPLAPFCRKT